MDLDSIRTVLVTGGSGFIGSHLVCSLVCKHPEWKIINVDMLDYCCSPRSLQAVENKTTYKFIRGDVCNPLLLNHIFNSENIDVVFHLAAKTHVESSFKCPSSFQRVNVEGTRVLLSAALQAGHTLKRFIYVSTDEVYGTTQGQVFDESSPLRPKNPYATTKAAAETLALSYWDTHKFPVIITRSNNVYGPRQYTEKVIPKFLSLLHNNRKCTIQGTLQKSRHFLFVEDAVDAFLLLLEKGIVGEIYNMGTSCEIPILHLARELIRMVKNVPDSEVSDWLEFVPDRPSVELRYPISCEKLKQLGWRERVSWSQGITHTDISSGDQHQLLTGGTNTTEAVKWYKDNLDFWMDNHNDHEQIAELHPVMDR